MLDDLNGSSGRAIHLSSPQKLIPVFRLQLGVHLRLEAPWKGFPPRRGCFRGIPRCRQTPKSMLSSRISHILRLAALLSLLLGLSAFAEARVVGPQVSSVQSLAGASPTVVVANGTSTATMTVTLLDAALTPIAGQAVEFSSDGTNNFLTQPTAMTDAMGVVMGTIASTKAELKTITVTVDPLGAAILLDAQPTIDFIGDLSNVSPSLSSVAGAPTVNLVADGAMASTISITG